MTARHRTPAPSVPRRILSRAGSILLTALSVLGALCLVLVVLGLTMNMSLIMFSTGSMAPTIPAGSVALVQEIPANEVEVGDVVTVEREGQLPITHRVTDILETSGDAVTFTMQGDANADPDADPYTAETVRLVRGSVPGIAGVVAGFQNPVLLGGLTVAAALLVTWAFWPRPDEESGLPSQG